MGAAGLAQGIDQSVGAFGRAVDHHQFVDARVQQGRGHAAGSATGADQQHPARAQVQAMATGEVVDQAGAVGVVALPVAIDPGQGIAGAGASRAVTGPGAQGEGGFLQWQGDIAATPAGGGEAFQRGAEIIRRRVDGGVFQGDAAQPGEGRVDLRRKRVRDRMAENGVTGGAHVSQSSRSQRAASSAK